MHDCFHDDAPDGCSCKKYRPAAIWSRYNWQQNCRWIIALVHCSSSRFGSQTARFSACHVLNAVQSGLPIMNKGCCSAINLRAFSRFDRRSKFHAHPSSGSTVVKSRAKPGVSPKLGNRSSILVMRGGEKTSVIIRLALARRSRLYDVRPPNCCTIKSIMGSSMGTTSGTDVIGA